MTLEKAQEEIKRLQGIVKDLEKERSWPNTLKGMREQSYYWGFEIVSYERDMDRYPDRYIVPVLGSYEGIPLDSSGYWTDKEDMINNWIPGTGQYNEWTYNFIKFNSSKELYLWMSEQEKGNG